MHEDLTKQVINITKTTISTKLRSFQYRPLMGALITNKNLKMYGLIDSDNCTFCNNATL